MERGSTLVLLALVCLAGADNCGISGVQFCKDSDQGDYGWESGSDAYVEYLPIITFDARWLGLRGSFIAKTTGSHTFQLNTGTEWPSRESFPVDITIDSSTTNTATAGYTRTLSMTVDFRYAFRAYMTDSRFKAWMELQVTVPSESAKRIDGTYAELCYENGCRNTALQRSPYNCKPPPSRSRSKTPSVTRSRSPTRTISRTPSPTGSISHTPTETHSPHATWTMPPSPTATDTPTQSATETSLFTLSESLNVSDVLAFSDDLRLSDSLNASFAVDESQVLNESCDFTGSEFGTGSDAILPSMLGGSDVIDSSSTFAGSLPVDGSGIFTESYDFSGSDAGTGSDRILRSQLEPSDLIALSSALPDSARIEGTQLQRSDLHRGSQQFSRSGSFPQTATWSDHKPQSANQGTIAAAAGAGAGVLVIVAIVIGVALCRRSDGIESETPSVEMTATTTETPALVTVGGVSGIPRESSRWHLRLRWDLRL
jgi:hypothetical protein